MRGLEDNQKKNAKFLSLKCFAPHKMQAIHDHKWNNFYGYLQGSEKESAMFPSIFLLFCMTAPILLLKLCKVMN